jgi:hypothetical protein
MEMKSYLFRTAGASASANGNTLLENVVAAINELAGAGHALEMFQPAAAVASDRDGPMVIMPMKAPRGWYHHVQPVLQRHGLDCRDYL